MSDIINLTLTEDDVVLPCPFCGADRDEIELQNTWTAHYQVKCQECGAQVQDDGVDRDPDNMADHQASKAAALAAWNRRAPHVGG